MSRKTILELAIDVVGNGFEVKLSTCRDGLLGKWGFKKQGDYVATSADELAELCADLVRSCVKGGPVMFAKVYQEPKEKVENEQ
jgi:hypothetical protein